MPTRSKFGSQPKRTRITDTAESGSVNVHLDAYNTHTWVDSVTFGENIPGWRQNLRDGLSATTSMTGLKQTSQLTNGSLRVSSAKNGNPGHVYLGEVAGYMGVGPTIPGDPSTIDETKANSSALGKFNSRIREITTKFEGGVFLGELGQTLSMIRNPAKGLRGLADDARQMLKDVRRASSRFTNAAGSRARSNTIKSITENLSSAWLEAQFGWKPLLNDIKDGSEALGSLMNKQMPKTVRISRRAKVAGNPSEVEVEHSVSWIKWKTTTVAASDCEVIYRGAMRVDAQDPVMMRAETLGFNPGSFLPTVWELIPYSFLIDYFTNVGEVIEGWSTMGTRLAWCNRTVRKSLWSREYSRASVDDYRVWYPGTPLSVSCTPGRCVTTKTRVVRAEYTGTFVPKLTLDVPGSGSLKWLNIAALIANRSSDLKWVYGD
jgi:hypothetical protein